MELQVPAAGVEADLLLPFLLLGGLRSAAIIYMRLEHFSNSGKASAVAIWVLGGVGGVMIIIIIIIIGSETITSAKTITPPLTPPTTPPTPPQGGAKEGRVGRSASNRGATFVRTL